MRLAGPHLPSLCIGRDWFTECQVAGHTRVTAVTVA